jgi:DNA replication and repair protein RecF
LLRRDALDEAQLEAWDVQLVTHGAVLIDQRREFVRQLSFGAAETYRAVAGKEECRVTYQPDVSGGDVLAGALIAARASDRRQGLTTRGPHRDDVNIEVEGKNARSFASQGQQKTVALALKLAEVELVRARAGEYPILLLDDVLSELDRSRSAQLAGVIPTDLQCVLTTTDLTDGDVFGRGAASHHIHGGRFSV